MSQPIIKTWAFLKSMLDLSENLKRSHEADEELEGSRDVHPKN